MPSHAQARAVQQRDEAVPLPEEGQQENRSSSGWNAKSFVIFVIRICLEIKYYIC